jgi:hypothetical protein
LPGTWGISRVVLAAALSFASVYPQTALDDLRGRYTRESDPIRRAKLLPKLGDAEFQEVQKQVTDGSLPDAIAGIRQYRDQVQTCVSDLDAREPDPEKHPSGFKQLQISLRESLRRLDDMMASLTGDEQKQFRELRNDLEKMDRHVIHELFPRQPVGEAGPGKPKN